MFGQLLVKMNSLLASFWVAHSWRIFTVYRLSEREQLKFQLVDIFTIFVLKPPQRHTPIYAFFSFLEASSTRRIPEFSLFRMAGYSNSEKNC
jgi:hypothetical protein